MSAHTKTLRASVIDGIAITPRYRERQLAAIHKTISSAKDDLTKALSKHSATRSEATAEYLLTLNAIKSLHAECDPVASKDNEYAIANSKDDPSRRAPHGYAYIKAASHSPLYSVVVPVAAAIAAGNVVLLQKHTGSGSVEPLIEQVLSRALLAETFAVVEKDPFDAKFQLSRGINFEGSSSANAVTTSKRIYAPTLRTAAIIDRSADVKAAATDLVQARFGLGGSSPYAPDIVLVNDFRVKELTEALSKEGLQYFSQSIGDSGTSSKFDSSFANELGSNSRTIVSGDRGRIVLLQSRESQLISRKITSPALLILPITSGDDAIDLLNASEHPLLASYIYATPTAAKYLSQFVRSAASYVNHIPADLLIGGPAPSGYTTTAHPRYSSEMFSVAAPALLHQSVQSQTIAGLLSLATTPKQKQSLEGSIDAKLTPFKEPFGPSIGFFEQGFLFNASVILIGLSIGTFYGIKYGYPVLMSNLRNFRH